MGEERPIRARNIAARERVLPQPGQRGRILGPGELIEEGLMPAVERLLQMLGAGLRPAREQNAQHMQLVVVGRLGALDLEADQEPPQLPARQAGADDRAMQALMQLPNLRAPLRGRGKLGGRIARWRQRRRHRGVAGARRPSRFRSAGVEHLGQELRPAGRHRQILAIFRWV
jgi:hypothetical protein